MTNKTFAKILIALFVVLGYLIPASLVVYLFDYPEGHPLHWPGFLIAVAINVSILRLVIQIGKDMWKLAEALKS